MVKFFCVLVFIWIKKVFVFGIVWVCEIIFFVFVYVWKVNSLDLLILLRVFLLGNKFVLVVLNGSIVMDVLI